MVGEAAAAATVATAKAIAAGSGQPAASRWSAATATRSSRHAQAGGPGRKVGEILALPMVFCQLVVTDVGSQTGSQQARATAATAATAAAVAAGSVQLQQLQQL